MTGASDGRRPSAVQTRGADGRIGPRPPCPRKQMRAPNTAADGGRPRARRRPTADGRRFSGGRPPVYYGRITSAVGGRPQARRRPSAHVRTRRPTAAARPTSDGGGSRTAPSNMSAVGGTAARPTLDGGASRTAVGRRPSAAERGRAAAAKAPKIRSAPRGAVGRQTSMTGASDCRRPCRPAAPTAVSGRGPPARASRCAPRTRRPTAADLKHVGRRHGRRTAVGQAAVRTRGTAADLKHADGRRRQPDGASLHMRTPTTVGRRLGAPAAAMHYGRITDCGPTADGAAAGGGRPQARRPRTRVDGRRQRPSKIRSAPRAGGGGRAIDRSE